MAKKQPTVCRSSTKSKYKATANDTAEILWLQSLFADLGIPLTSLVVLWCDNVGPIYLTSNPAFHARTKYIEIDYHFVREQVAFGNILVRLFSSKDQLVDLFTKPFAM